MKLVVRRKLKLIHAAKNHDTTQCIFCKSQGVTNEHVFSQWTHKYLEPRGRGKATGIAVVQYSDKEEKVSFKMAGQMRDWQVKAVCGGNDQSCNNGWMRRLEEKVERLLPALMLGQSTRLTEPDHKLIAAWAIMKVMVVNHRIVHHLQRKSLMDRCEPPTGWGVWIGNYDRQRWPAEWVSRRFSVLSEDVFARRRNLNGAANSHATTLIFKKLFIHVVYCRLHTLVNWWRFPDPRTGSLSGHLVRIWPTNGYSSVWPRKPLTDLDAVTISDALLRTAASLSP